MRKIGEKILEKTVDLVLVSIYFNFEFAKHARWGRWKIEENVFSDLEKFDYRNLKDAFNYLSRNGFIQTFKERSLTPRITEIGLKKLSSTIPIYDEKRPWDGKIYLVTYDLPVERNKERNTLRYFLRKIGCGMLQYSVWITPYNPTDILRKFFEEKGLNELVIISSIGRDGTIGNMSLQELVEKVYHLDKINERYREFMDEVGSKKNTRGQLIFHFLLILNDDPQLPFALLPENWLGDKAYGLFRKFSGT